MKMTSQEDNLTGIRPHRKTTSQEDDLTEKRSNRKTTSKETTSKEDNYIGI